MEPKKVALGPSAGARAASIALDSERKPNRKHHTSEEKVMPKENQNPMFEFRFGPIMIKATGLEATLAAFTLAMLTLILAFH